MREFLCKILYKIGLKNAARCIHPEMYYFIYWRDCGKSLKESFENAAISISAVADSLKILSEVFDKGEGKQ